MSSIVCDRSLTIKQKMHVRDSTTSCVSNKEKHNGYFWFHPYTDRVL